MEEETKKTCFVIMPITTPKIYHERYGDEDHFRHVLQCLFEPAIRMAGFIPIPPTSKGSENIQADIIKKLETSDLVLCDMSILNANVFFEFGIRTALDKPICLVRDEFLDDIPFDPSSINCPKYLSNLSSWIVTTEIEKLAIHIKDSYESNDRHNPLWKYFGFNMTAKPEEGSHKVEDILYFMNEKIDRFIAQISNPENTMYNPKQRILINVNGELVRSECTFTDIEYIQTKMNDLLLKYNVNYNNLTYQMTPSGKISQLDITGVMPLSQEFFEELRALAHKYHFAYKISA